MNRDGRQGWRKWRRKRNRKDSTVTGGCEVSKEREVTKRDNVKHKKKFIRIGGQRGKHVET